MLKKKKKRLKGRKVKRRDRGGEEGRMITIYQISRCYRHFRRENPCSYVSEKQRIALSSTILQVNCARFPTLVFSFPCAGSALATTCHPCLRQKDSWSSQSALEPSPLSSPWQLSFAVPMQKVLGIMPLHAFLRILFPAEEISGKHQRPYCR